MNYHLFISTPTSLHKNTYYLNQVTVLKIIASIICIRKGNFSLLLDEYFILKSDWINSIDNKINMRVPCIKPSSVFLSKTKYFKEKKEAIWLSHMTKAPTPIEKSRKERDNTKMPPKASITQRLWTDLGRSDKVTTAIPLVWLNRFTSALPSP